MTACQTILSALAACCLLASPAHAQPAAAVATAAAQPAPARLAGAPALATTAQADLKLLAAQRAGTASVVTAAGSVLLLADGIVANARMAQVVSPAPGFDYER